MNRSILNVGLRFKGHVSVRGYDLNWNFIDYQEVDNLIVSGGYDLLASTLIGDSVISHIGVGYGTTAVTAADVDLEHVITSRVPITESTRTGAVCLFSTFFNTTDCNPDPSSLGWTECGLFTGETGNNMISRALFMNKIYKNNTRRYQVDWTITISGV